MDGDAPRHGRLAGPARAARPAAAPRGGGAPRRRGGSTRLRPWPGDRPPRREAGQRAARRDRPRLPRRLRHRADARGLVGGHRHRPHPGHAELHGPRAGDGGEGGPPRRRVRARRDGVRVPDWPRALHGDDAGRDPDEARAGAGAGADRGRGGAPARRRAAAVPRQGAVRALALGRGVRRRAGAGRGRGDAGRAWLAADPDGASHAGPRHDARGHARTAGRAVPEAVEVAVGCGRRRGGARRAGRRGLASRSGLLRPGADGRLPQSPPRRRRLRPRRRPHGHGPPRRRPSESPRRRPNGSRLPRPDRRSRP